MVQTAKENLENENLKAAEEKYLESALIFEKYEDTKLDCAKSYFSCQKYEKAKHFFVCTNSWFEAGECILRIINPSSEKKPNDQPISENIKKLYNEAIEYFDKAHKYNKAIECCDIIKNHKKIVKLLLKYQQNINHFNKIFANYLKNYLDEIEQNFIDQSNLILV